jgi:hypothetical protein
VISIPQTHSTDEDRQRPHVREHGGEVEPAAFGVDRGHQPVHHRVGAVRPDDDDGRQRRSTEEVVEQLRVERDRGANHGDVGEDEHAEESRRHDQRESERRDHDVVVLGLRVRDVPVGESQEDELRSDRGHGRHHDHHGRRFERGEALERSQKPG